MYVASSEPPIQVFVEILDVKKLFSAALVIVAKYPVKPLYVLAAARSLAASHPPQLPPQLTNS